MKMSAFSFDPFYRCGRVAPETVPGALMPTPEEGQRLLNSLRTFYVVVTQNPYGLAQIKQGDASYICVWSSNRKAKAFAFSQQLPRSKYRVVGMDAVTLNAFSQKMGIERMMLDYVVGRPNSDFIWFYMGQVGAN